MLGGFPGAVMFESRFMLYWSAFFAVLLAISTYKLQQFIRPLSPRVRIKRLLEEEWTLGPVPGVMNSVHEKPFPQIVISYDNMSPREISTGYQIDPNDDMRRMEARLAVEVWAPDKSTGWDYREEVNRILWLKHESPGSPIERMSVSSWTDRGFTRTMGGVPLYRYRVSLDVIYYELIR